MSTYADLLQSRSGVVISSNTVVSVNYNGQLLSVQEFLGLPEDTYYSNTISVVETLSHVLIVTGGRIREYKLEENRFLGSFSNQAEEMKYVSAILEKAVSELGTINYPIAKNVRALLLSILSATKSDNLRELVAIFDSIAAISKAQYLLGRSTAVTSRSNN